MSSQLTSVIRIGVAALIGTLVRIAQNKWGYDIDGETLTAAVTGGAIGLYYSAAREVEKRWPRIKPLGLANPDS